MSKHALITGAASGIGAAIARRFAAQGWVVSGSDIREEELASQMASFAPTGSILPCDLSDADATSSLITRAWDARGPVNVLVNAAGIYPARSFLNLTVELWDRVQAVNVRAPMVLTQTLAARAIADGLDVTVVNISSGAALRARPGAAHYSTSKAALEMLTKAAAVELGEYGIRVNAVSPGFVTVNSTANPVSKQYADKVSANPLGRRGEPNDVAAAVLWLASEEASWVTGAVLRVDGGASAGTTDLPEHWPVLTDVQTPPSQGALK